MTRIWFAAAVLAFGSGVVLAQGTGTARNGKCTGLAFGAQPVDCTFAIDVFGESSVAYSSDVEIEADGDVIYGALIVIDGIAWFRRDVPDRPGWCFEAKNDDRSLCFTPIE